MYINKSIAIFLLQYIHINIILRIIFKIGIVIDLTINTYTVNCISDSYDNKKFIIDSIFFFHLYFI